MKERRFKVDDLVLAKVPGYRPWPARIVSIEDQGTTQFLYRVRFYARNISAVCSEDKLADYTNTNPKIGHTRRTLLFNKALNDINRDVAGLREVIPTDRNPQRDIEGTAASKKSPVPYHYENDDFNSNCNAQTDKAVASSSSAEGTSTDQSEECHGAEQIANVGESRIPIYQGEETEGNPRRRFKVDDLVLAKVPGYCPWPARIVSIEDQGTFPVLYRVRFYARNISEVCSEDKLADYTDTKPKIGRTRRTLLFNKALSDINRDVAGLREVIPTDRNPQRDIEGTAATKKSPLPYHYENDDLNFYCNKQNYMEVASSPTAEDTSSEKSEECDGAEQVIPTDRNPQRVIEGTAATKKSPIPYHCENDDFHFYCNKQNYMEVASSPTAEDTSSEQSEECDGAEQVIPTDQNPQRDNEATAATKKSPIPYHLEKVDFNFYCNKQNYMEVASSPTAEDTSSERSEECDGAEQVILIVGKLQRVIEGNFATKISRIPYHYENDDINIYCNKQNYMEVASSPTAEDTSSERSEECDGAEQVILIVGKLQRVIEGNFATKISRIPYHYKNDDINIYCNKQNYMEVASSPTAEDTSSERSEECDGAEQVILIVGNPQRDIEGTEKSEECDGAEQVILIVGNPQRDIEGTEKSEECDGAEQVILIVGNPQRDIEGTEKSEECDEAEQVILTDRNPQRDIEGTAATKKSPLTYHYENDDLNYYCHAQNCMEVASSPTAENTLSEQSEECDGAEQVTLIVGNPQRDIEGTAATKKSPLPYHYENDDLNFYCNKQNYMEVASSPTAEDTSSKKSEECDGAEQVIPTDRNPQRVIEGTAATNILPIPYHHENDDFNYYCHAQNYMGVALSSTAGDTSSEQIDECDGAEQVIPTDRNPQCLIEGTAAAKKSPIPYHYENDDLNYYCHAQNCMEVASSPTAEDTSSEQSEECDGAEQVIPTAQNPQRVIEGTAATKISPVPYHYENDDLNYYCHAQNYMGVALSSTAEDTPSEQNDECDGAEQVIPTDRNPQCVIEGTAAAKKSPIPYHYENDDLIYYCNAQNNMQVALSTRAEDTSSEQSEECNEAEQVILIVRNPQHDIEGNAATKKSPIPYQYENDDLNYYCHAQNCMEVASSSTAEDPSSEQSEECDRAEQVIHTDRNPQRDIEGTAGTKKSPIPYHYENDDFNHYCNAQNYAEVASSSTAEDTSTDRSEERHGAEQIADVGESRFPIYEIGNIEDQGTSPFLYRVRFYPRNLSEACSEDNLADFTNTKPNIGNTRRTLLLTKALSDINRGVAGLREVFMNQHSATNEESIDIEETCQPWINQGPSSPLSMTKENEREDHAPLLKEFPEEANMRPHTMCSEGSFSSEIASSPTQSLSVEATAMKIHNPIPKVFCSVVSPSPEHQKAFPVASCSTARDATETYLSQGQVEQRRTGERQKRQSNQIEGSSADDEILTLRSDLLKTFTDKIHPPCGKAFNSKTTLKEHSQEHSVCKPNKYPWCVNSNAQRESLNRPMHVHTQDKTYKCTQCGKSFSRWCALAAHTRSHNGERPNKRR